MRRAFALWRLIVSTMLQPAGAPFIDHAVAVDTEGRHYRGVAILAAPWRRRGRDPILSLVLVWRKLGDQ